MKSSESVQFGETFGHTGLDRVRIVIRPVASFQKSNRREEERLLCGAFLSTDHSDGSEDRQKCRLIPTATVD
jgi:hypothetical protein